MRPLPPLRFLALSATLVVASACDCEGDGAAPEFVSAPSTGAPSESETASEPSYAEDADGDGFDAADDRCPNEPEDCDGFEDHDGCPELDNEEDGIPDACDACPDARETANGFRDDDGCPDVPPAVGALPFLYFTGSAPRSLAPLDEWTRALNEASHVTEAVLLAAETSTTSHEVLLARAETARDALVERGIDPTRLVATTGYLVSGHAPSAEQERLARGGPIPPVVTMALGSGSPTRPVPRRCPSAPPTEPGACPTAPATVSPSSPVEGAEGVHRVAPSRSAQEACAQLILGEAPSYAERCIRISPIERASGLVRSASVVELGVIGEDSPLYLTLETPAGYEYFVRIGRATFDALSDTFVGVDEIRIDRIFEGGGPEVLVRWSSVTRGGETVGADAIELDERTSYVTLCSVEGVPTCRTLPTLVRHDVVSTSGDRVTEWKRKRGAIVVDWRANGDVRIDAVDDPGVLRPLLGTHRWPAIPALDPDVLAR